ncbi:MAG: rhodanese-like domain-containing protein [Acidobacteriota bacterium]|nr:rhodanese-like domain-containing protein [Acidobacteriota bacterium]
MFARLMGLDTVSPAALHQLMQREPVITIDVNSPQSWARARVPGARNLEPLAYKDSDLPSDKEAVLIFYCSNFLCRKAPNAALRAKRMGYPNVRVMSAGISGWLDAALPTESGEPAPAHLA